MANKKIRRESNISLRDNSLYTFFYQARWAWSTRETKSKSILFLSNNPLSPHT